MGNTGLPTNSHHFIWIGLIHMKLYAIRKPTMIGGLGRHHITMKQYLDARNGQSGLIEQAGEKKIHVFPSFFLSYLFIEYSHSFAL